MVGRFAVTRAGTYILSILVGASSFGALVACTSSSSGPAPATITLNLGSTARTQGSGSGVQHISIEVSASDMAPVIWTWDQNGNSQAAPPPSVALTIPQGAGRLFQVLEAVGTTSGMVFEYGQAVATVTGDNSSVGITVNSVKGVSATGQGQVSGHFSNPDGTSPTGKVHMLYSPPGGAPKMIIQDTEIFGGWFSFFLLQGVKFDYVMAATGVPIMTGVTADGGGVIATGAQNVLSAYNPAPYKCNNGGSCSGANAFSMNGTMRMIVGFFGGGAAASKIFYDGSSSVAMSSYSMNASGTPTLIWNGTAVPTASSNSAGVETGGVACAGAACPASGTYPSLSTLYVDSNMFQSNDSPLGIKGPYLAFPKTGTQSGGSGSFIKMTYAAATGLTVNWQYAPSANSGIAGTEVFYLVHGVPTPSPTPAAGSTNSGGGGYSQPAYDTGNGVACGQLASTYGFKSAGVQSPSTTSVVITDTNITSANSNYTDIVLCPVNPNPPPGAPKYFATGAYQSSSNSGNYGNNNGGGNGFQPVTQFAVQSLDYNQTTVGYNNVCIPIRIVGLTASGSYAQSNSINTATTVSLASADANTTFYTSSNCTGTVMTWGSSTGIFYMKRATTGPASVQVTATGSYNGTTYTTAAANALTLTMSDGGNATALKFYVDNGPGGTGIKPYIYTPVYFLAVDANGVIANYTGSTVTINLAGAGLHNTPMGMSMSTTTSITSSYPLVIGTLWAVVSGTAWNMIPSTYTIISSLTGGSLTAPAVLTAPVSVPGQDTTVTFNMGSIIGARNCYSLSCNTGTFAVTDSSGNYSPVSAATNISFSSADQSIQFWTTPNCSGTPTTSIVETIPVSSINCTSGSAYFSVPTQGTTPTLTATTTSGDSLTGQLALTVGPETPASFNVYSDSTAHLNTACQPFMVALETNFHAVPTQVAGSVSITASGANTASLFSDPTCTTPLAGGVINFNIGDSAKIGYYTLASTSGSGYLLPSASNNLGIAAGNSATVNATATSSSTPANGLRIVGSAAPKVNYCQPYMIYGVNTTYANMAPSSPVTTTAGLMDFNGSSAIYSDAACTTTGGVPFGSSASPAAIFYVKPSSASGVNFGGTVTISGSGVTVGGTNSTAVGIIP